MKLVSYILLVFILICFLASSSGGVVATIRYYLNSAYNAVKCVSECCVESSEWISPDFIKLKSDLKQKVHGQHLINEVVINAIKGHYDDPNPKKALVLSLHGDTGTGKTFVSEIVADALFKKGFESKYYTKFIQSVDFQHESRVDLYKLDLIDKIREKVSSCHRNLFVFDEVHKLPRGLIDAIKPFIDYHSNINGVDYRKSIFIFLSNTGSKKVLEFMLDWWSEGKSRSEITLQHIEPLMQNGAFNEKGGLHMSELIEYSLVDFYVPFLPMEKKHIELCVRDSLGRKGKYSSTDIIRKVADDIPYFPKENPLFASKGCKNVYQKINYFLINDEL